MNERVTPERETLHNHIVILQADLTGVRADLAERNLILRELRQQCNQAEIARDRERGRVDQLRVMLESVTPALQGMLKDSPAWAYDCERLLARIDSVMQVTA